MKLIDVFEIASQALFNQKMCRITEQQRESVVIQTLILSKRRFKTKQDAVNWALNHNFKVTKPVDETENNWRIRQRNPNDFKKETFVTWSITSGVQAVGGKLK